jgi:hypothetical protein
MLLASGSSFSVKETRPLALSGLGGDREGKQHREKAPEEFSRFHPLNVCLSLGILSPDFLHSRARVLKGSEREKLFGSFLLLCFMTPQIPC